jgi:hypothetical protein
LQPADPSVPATQWVANLREEIPSIPVPAFPDFEAVYGKSFVDEHGLRPIVGYTEPPTAPSTARIQAPLVQYGIDDQPLEPFEPSAEFEEDAALLHRV